MVQLTGEKITVRCARNMYVLDPIEPSGIVIVASIIMPHGLYRSGRFGMMTCEPTYLVLGLSPRLRVHRTVIHRGGATQYFREAKMPVGVPIANF